MRTPLRMPLTALALLLAPLLSAGAADQKAPAKIVVLPVIGAASVTGPQLPTSLSLPAAINGPTQPTASVLPAAASVSKNAAVNPAASAAKAAQPVSDLPPSANAENAARVVEALSQANAAQLSGEDAANLARRLMDGRGSERGFTAVATPDAFSPAASLAPWERQGPHASGPAANLIAGGASNAAGSRKVSWKERIHYRRLWVENLYFYIVTNIVNKYGQYSGDHARLKAAGITPPVSKARKFFAHMRVMGQTGEFYVPGFTPRHDQAVLDEARDTFIKYFDGPGITDEHRRSFEGFLQRAMAYNVERRAASKFRAHVRDSMLKASVMDPAKMPAFFDGLPIVNRTAEFQAGAADAILAQFQKIVLEEVAKEPQDAKDRITGIILIGSFALGAATPTSDFDVEPLTADGGSGRVRGFSERLIARWKEVGRQQVNPVTFHMFGYLNSRWELQKIHHEPYLIISHDKSIVENLSMRPGEPRDHIPSRDLKPVWGPFLRWAQYAAVYLTSLFTRPQ